MNRLAAETSPYLLQHKDNPVHWWPWGPDALAEARATGRPILLSVGYAACHWCHVMAHESFEDDATAAVMNELFVCIKVDREERPDIDAIYMGALHRLGQQGGWPLTMFLDGDARPFYGGTYFPKEGRFGRPTFTSVLHQVARIYTEDRDTVAHNGTVLTDILRRSAEPSAPGSASVDLAAVGDLTVRMLGACDPVHGGLNGAPKFPQWSFLALLWRGGIRFGHAGCRDATLLTLDRLCQGGIYDHLGGGLARYSVDDRWLAPHFEKMLYDNAQFIELLTEAWRETTRPLFATRVRETVGWLLAEMTTDEGAFAASLDADSEGEEGKFYVWTAAEVAEVLGAPYPPPSWGRAREGGNPGPAVPGNSSPSPLGTMKAVAPVRAEGFPPSLTLPHEGGGESGRGESDFALFARIYDVTAAGNWEGHTILNRLLSGDLGEPETEQRLAAMRDRLLARRTSRVRPGLDDKVLADWNGLMIAALSRASVVFGEPRWLDAARRAFAFVAERMTDGPTDGGRLYHSYRAGRTTARGLAADYANMIWAALRLYEATAEPAYLDRARTWTAALDRHHWVDGGGYATSADDARDVLVRLRSASDDAAPSANATMASNLAALALLTEDARYLDRAAALRGAFASDLAGQPIGHCGLIAASVDAEAQVHVAISGTPPDSGLASALHGLALPGAIETSAAPSVQSAAAIVCVGQTCSAPITDPTGLRAQLLAARAITGGA